MKFIIVAAMFLVVLMQSTSDFAIHEGRKRAWHRWKAYSLLMLGLVPLILWLMQDTPPNIGDYIASILIPYFVAHWLWKDILMNEYLNVNIDYIDITSDLGIWLRKIFPKQPGQGYLWVRFLAYVLYQVSWIVEWWPGHYFLHL